MQAPGGNSAPGSLWRDGPFVRYFGSSLTWSMGEQVGLLALPLTAVLTLHVGAAQLGALAAAGRLPFLLLGLPVGVWIDRWRKKPVLLATSGLYFGSLLTVPIAAAGHRLTFPHLLLVALATGITSVFFDVAELAFIPYLSGPTRILEANAKLAYTYSAGSIAGPSLAGALVQALTAPIALAVDALMSLAGGLLLLTVPGDPRPAEQPQQSLVAGIREGLAFVLGHPLLRSIAAITAVSNLFASGFGTVRLLFFVRDLGLSPALIGLVLTAPGPGMLIGVVLAPRIAGRLGTGPAICIGSIAFCALPLLVPGLPAGAWFTLPVLGLTSFAGTAGAAVFNVNQVSLRLAVTPAALLGRMNATVRFLIWGTIPVGAALGGLLAQSLGFRTALWICAAGGLSALVWVVLPPLWSLKRVPSPPA